MLIVLLVLVAFGMVAACSSAGSASTTRREVAGTRVRTATVFRPQFGSSGLVTNEYAYRHPDDPARHASRYWIVTSGSLFAMRGAGWTGVPDRETPNAQSSNGTDSAVFRVRSRPRNFGDVRVTFELFVQRHTIVPGSKRHAYDGVHVWLRYASQTEVYTMSVMRWDGQVVIKRKTPGGPSNGGSYQTLASAPSVMSVGHWVTVDVESINRSAGVELAIVIDGKLVLHQIDSSSHALTQPGAVGIRGDNTQFEFRDFEARSL